MTEMINGQVFYPNYQAIDDESRAAQRGRHKPVILNKQQKFLQRKVSRHQRKFVYRMGYQMAVGLYAPEESYSRFTGSSLNKKQNAKKINQSADKGVQKIPFPAGPGDNEIGQSGSQADALWADSFVKSNYHAKVSQALKRRSPGLHVLSARSRGRVRDKCTAFFRASHRERIFCTLTFIQRVTDKMAVKILNSFLTVIRQESKKRFQYIWVAERQRDTGNIHFHLLMNRRLPIVRFNALWVLQQYNAGLSYGIIGIDEIRSRVQDGTMQQILNPVDIKKIHTINKLSNYLTKYITKGNNSAATGDGFDCAVWHCSRGISMIFTNTVVGRSAFAATESFINAYVNKKTGELIEAKRVDHQFYSVRYIVNRSYFLQFLKEMEMINGWILEGVPISRDQVPSITADDFRQYFLNDAVVKN